MNFLQDVMNYILNDLGSAIFIPAIILILGLVVGVKFKDAIVSALTMGVAFTGMSIVVGFMVGAIGPATEALAKNTGINLPVVDVGWTGAAAITWTWTYAMSSFAIMIGVNLIMLTFKWTKTLNIDFWNAWGKALTSFLVFTVTGNLVFAFIAAALQCVLELKLADAFQKHIEDLTGIPLVSTTHFMTSAVVLLMPINWVMDKIPFFNKRLDVEGLKAKIGVFSENSVMGFVLGLTLGFASAYTVSGSLNIAIQVATAMVLLPMIAKMFMTALAPIADKMSEFTKSKFKDREIIIGLDWPILAGRAEVWTTMLLLVPVILIWAVILPGNEILPVAGILNFSIAVSGLLLTGGNILRMLVMGIITAPVYLLGSTWLAPILTGLSNQIGAIEGVEAGQRVSWSSFEAPEFRVLVAEVFNGNIIAIGGALVFVLMIVWTSKYMNKAKVPSQRYEN
ncbi:PTS galactitol transporter subunit IIC [Lactococcus ileimucosae]|uniref:PTS galactitol transporter subunit IIC n=1 Tax=Lactococcus ileimucosae TaxID=2941329 RepID=UPI0020432B7B|nr:PTS transporter subunit IIC [Lactococcus ileimucosae]